MAQIRIFAGNCVNSFTVVRTWTFDDGCGNISSVNQTITVDDNTAPTWDFGCQIATTYTTNGGADCPADAGISLNVGNEISVNSTWTVGGITVPNLSGCVGDNCTSASNLIIRVTGKTDDNASDCQQQLSITFEAEDECGNIAGNFTCVYNFVDDTAPTPPAAPADVNVQCADDIPPPVDLTATDNCQSDITVSPTAQVVPGSCANNFIMVRTWSFDDGCGTELHFLFEPSYS